MEFGRRKNLSSEENHSYVQIVENNILPNTELNGRDMADILWTAKHLQDWRNSRISSIAQVCITGRQHTG